MPATARERLDRRALETLTELFELERPEADARLAALAGSDDELHREVIALWRATEESGGFLSRPLLGPLPAARTIPARIGPFQVLDTIASGGMGVVVHARRTEPFLQDVAIKLMHGALPAEERSRFADERRYLARIEHPNVARIIDGGELEDGQPYLAQEYVPGKPIDDDCADRSLSLESRLTLFLGVLDGVEAVHAAGVIHCDLKPDNVLVDATHRPRIVDFGISQLAASPHPLTRYSLETASPEILAGRPPSVQSDVYALGRTLERLLDLGPAAGSRPWAGLAAASPVARLRKADLRRLVALACAPALEDRLRTAAELRDGILAVLGRRPVVAPRRRRPLTAWLPRTATGLAAVALVGVGAMLALGWGAARLRFERRERVLVEEATRRCEALLAATDQRARRSVADAEAEGAAHARRLEELAAWAETVAAPPNAGSGLARGCGAFAAFDFRKASVALAPAAHRRSAGALEKRLWARSLWYRGRLDNDNVRRLISGTEQSGGPILRLGRTRIDQIQLAFDAATEVAPAAAGIEVAMLATSQGRWDDALRRIRQVAAEAPTAFEARRVEVEAALASALARPDGPGLEGAEAALAAGLAVAPADPWLWLSDCRMGGARLAAPSRRQGPAAVAEEATRAGSSCRTALRLAPALVDALTVEAMVRYDAGRALAEAGVDPAGETAVVAERVARLLVARPDDPTAFLLRGNAANLEAHWLLHHGSDPSERLAAAERDLEEALRLSGGASRPLNALGSVEAQRGAWVATSRGDAAGPLRAAIDRFRAALERAPATPLYLVNLGQAHLALARNEATPSQDVESDAAAAIAAFDLALELTPGHASALEGRVSTRLLLLERRSAAGGEGGDLVAAIEDDLERLAALGAAGQPELRARFAASRARVGL